MIFLIRIDLNYIIRDILNNRGFKWIETDPNKRTHLHYTDISISCTPLFNFTQTYFYQPLPPTSSEILYSFGRVPSSSKLVGHTSDINVYLRATLKVTVYLMDCFSLQLYVALKKDLNQVCRYRQQFHSSWNPFLSFPYRNRQLFHRFPLESP